MSRRRRTKGKTAAPRGQGGRFVRRSLMNTALTPGRGRLPSCTKATTRRTGVRPDQRLAGPRAARIAAHAFVLGAQRRLISARSAQRQGGLEVGRRAASPEGTEREGASTAKEAKPPGASRFSLQREGARHFAMPRRTRDSLVASAMSNTTHCRPRTRFKRSNSSRLSCPNASGIDGAARSR